ncbi:MAG: mechanosensitive ion channel family protein [Bacteroidales bacterium]
MNNIIGIFGLYYAPLLMVLSGLIIGWLAEKIIISRLIKLSEKTAWKSDDILFRSLKNLVWPLFLIGGIYLAIHNFKDLPQRIVKAGDLTVSVSYILLVTLYFSRVFSRFIQGQAFDSQKQGTSTILTNLVRTVILSVGIMIALQSVGISIQPLLTALGITGLAVALALQSTLSNFFSGLHIIASRRLSPGDFIKVDQNIEGYISDINWRSTILQQLSNNMIIIPNSKLADAIVINTSLPEPEAVLNVSCNISYDSNLDVVESLSREIAHEVIAKVEGCIPGSEPVVRFQSFEENSIKFSIFIRVTSYPEQFIIRHELIKALHKRFKEEGIVIASVVRSSVIQEKGRE